MNNIQLRKLKLKWFSGAKCPAELKTGATKVVNWSIAFCRDSKGVVEGFSFFESTDLNQSFVDRLESRVAKLGLNKIKPLEIIIPEFAVSRWNSLCPPHLKDCFKVHVSPFIGIDKKFDFVEIRHRCRVASIDDSSVILKYLEHEFQELGFVEHVGSFTESRNASAQALAVKPDLITLDIQMPVKNGIEVLKEITAKQDIPVIMISSVELYQGSLVFEALNSGAFDYIQKPDLHSKAEFKEALKDKVLAAVGVGAHSAKKMAPPILKSASLLEENLPANTLWVLGSSTGGTQALTHILRCCPSRIPPILITQHIPPIFSKAFADSLNDLCPFTVKEAEDGDAVESGCVYIAPGDFQMKIIQGGGKLRIRIVDEPKVNRFKPSVDYMFDSLAKITGHNIVAGVLTGMGKDGAAGLLKLREAGAKTFAQDEESSIVYGMPKAAFDMGGASTQVALSRVAEELVRLSGLRLGKKVA